MNRGSLGLGMVEFDTRQLTFKQVPRICSIPLSRACLPDEIVWRYDGIENYSAKSGYRLLLAEQACTLSVELSSFFTEMWVTNVMAKLKLLMRKLVLPTVLIQVVGLWKDWVASYFATLTARNKRVLLVLYWSVWFSRNKLVHEGIHTSTDESMTFVEAYIREQDALGQVLSKTIPMWSAMTWVIGWNNQGLIMAACSYPHRHVAYAFVAEAYACK
ncbi:hypothetical protein V6N11_035450 [Hibiscus sabdariffa]|uniref:Uncharacterized protein n=1 Tax=Hibiscus sabdariffa TaxID=183260 RepID=A0ABR2R0T1_9ROSI